MKQFLIILLALLFGLNANPQTAPKPQNVTANQETQQPSDTVGDLQSPARSETDVRKEVGAKKQESDATESEKSRHRFSFLGLEVPDFVALGLGLAALAISMYGLKRNRISNQKQNRAYVAIKNVRTSQPKKDGYALTIHIDAENVGVTPANNVRIFRYYKFYDATSLEGGEIILRHRENSSNWGSMAPETQRHTNIEIPTGSFLEWSSLRSGVQSGDDVLHIEGWIEYSDVFGDKHATFFSGTLSDVDSIFGKSFNMTDTGNEMA